MRLKRLEIQGFKSFPDRVDMTFEQGVTGVVGPNGSGKSNISDAVRWVLGEQSAKTLRGSKMEDVIFNGTEKRRRLAACEVSLSFDNEDKALPVDYSEVCVTRRVYRNGEGEYSINKTPCRLRDVVDLFRDTGIGKEGYSLISQGRIDEVLSNKSEERRAVFEEAAGIVRYKSRKSEAEKRLENTQLNLSRVEDILSELEGRVEPLREQSETALRYVELQGELKGLELNMFLARSERNEARLREYATTLESFGTALQEALSGQEKLTAEREKLEENLTELEAETARERENVQEKIRVCEACEGNVSLLRERLSGAQKDLERLRAELKAAQEGESGVDAEIARLEKEIENDKAEYAEKSVTLESDKAALQAAEERLSALEEKLEKTKADLIAAMNSIADVKGERARLETMRDTLLKRIREAEQGSDLDAADTEELRKKTDEARETNKKYAEEKKHFDEEAALTDERRKKAEDKAEALEKAIRGLSEKRQSLISRLRLLEEMQRDYEGYQYSVKNVLMQAKNWGGAGVRGVVATLLKVSKEYERAIDMVLGGALQNIVVEKEEDAKRMIDYLRQNRLGRATFLPISAVHGRTLDANERRVLSMDGCVGLATELIGFDEEYRGIAENLLGRTIIARDLTAGIAIMRAGRQQFRLVTLEGDVMHSGGSMTGGSVQSKGVSLLSREREINETRQTLQETENTLTEYETKQKELNAALTKLRTSYAWLMDKQRQTDVLCARSEALLGTLEAEIRSRDERAGQSEKDREQLKLQLEDVESSLKEVSGNQSTQEMGQETLREDITRKTGELTKLRGEAGTLREKVQTASVRVATLSRGIDAMTRDRDRLSTQKRDMTKLLSDNRTLTAEKEGAVKETAEELDEAASSLEKEKKLLEEARSVFGEKDAKRAGVQERIREIGKKLDSLREEIDDFTERKHRTEMQKARVEDENAQMTKRIWETYELTLEGAAEFRAQDFKPAEADKRIAAIRQETKAMGTVNVAALDEYREVSQRVTEMSAQRDDLVKAQLDLQGIIEELQKKMEAQFRERFEALDKSFRATFVKLFGGGQAALRLTDPKDALGCDIEVVAQPPGKKLQVLTLLSGGERALTAIAILFAILDIKPTPFCFLDEIEAALDDANIDNFAEYLRDYSKNTQFIIVTHRKGTMERCDALYGVTMEEKGISRVMSVKLSEAERVG